MGGAGRRRATRVAAAALALLGTACGSTGAGEAVERTRPVRACVAVPRGLGPEATLSGHDGLYRVSLVRSGPDRSGETIGVMRLRARAGSDAELLGTPTPLGGSLAIDLDPIDVVAPGPTDASGPDAPGVLVLEATVDGRVEILLRLGADANRRDRVAFDQASLVLRVHRIGDGRFDGGWEATVGVDRAFGHFCAVRSG